MQDDIVITGLGLFSPLGIGVEETAAALREGAPALFPATRCAPPDGFSPLCGEVPAFRLEEFVPSPKAYLDRNSELFLAACGMALQQAGLDAKTLVPERSGILAGTAWSGQDTMAAFFADYAQKGPRLVKPFLFPHTYFNTAISLAAIEWSLRGPHQCFAAGRVSAGQALVAARDLLLENEADVLLAGGSEALGPALFRNLAVLGVLKPADRADAPGLVPGEAGAILVLERHGRAVARGVKPLAAILGAGLAATPATAMTAALQEAGVAPDALAGVVSSANGCAALDEAETAAMQQVLRGADVPVMTPAALCGDTQGVCAALHAALAVLMRAVSAAPGGTPLRPGPLLVLATDPTGAAVALVLGAGLIEAGTAH